MAIFQRIAAFFTALISFLAGVFGLGNPFVTDVQDFRVTTYIRGDYAQSANSIYEQDFDIITDVIVFECATFDNKGNVNVETNKLETTLKNLCTAIGDRDVHITLNLLGPGASANATGWEEQMESQSKEHNKAFESGVLEDNILAVLEAYDFDGVHFDYEYPLSEEAWDGFNRFLVSLDKKLGSYTLGVAAGTWNIQFSSAAIAAVDVFELMLYDFNDEEGRHATFEGTVQNLESIRFYGIPTKKINIGLPFYSRPTDLSAYWYGYNSYFEDIDENGWYHCPATDKDFWFNTPAVIEQKTAFAINNGYGGVMIWHYSCDLPSSHDASLLKAIDTAMQAQQ